MLFKTGVELEASFGVRPFHEGDLILRVGDELINQAQSIEDVIKYIDAAIPFIELPDIIAFHAPAMVPWDKADR